MAPDAILHSRAHSFTPWAPPLAPVQAAGGTRQTPRPCPHTRGHKLWNLARGRGVQCQNMGPESCSQTRGPTWHLCPLPCRDPAGGLTWGPIRDCSEGTPSPHSQSPHFNGPNWTSTSPCPRNPDHRAGSCSSSGAAGCQAQVPALGERQCGRITRPGPVAGLTEPEHTKSPEQLGAAPTVPASPKPREASP